MSYFEELSAREALRILQLRISDLEPSDIIYRTQVIKALNSLDMQLKKVAWAIGVLEMTQEETAKILRVNQSTVSRRWKEALCQLNDLV